MEGIGLSATIFDLNGALYIRSGDLDQGVDVQNRSRERRVSRTATLDGGMSVYDTGYAVADRVLNVKIPNPSAAMAAFFAYLVETYNSIVITTGESAYEGNPMRSYHDSDGAVTLEIGITEELT